MAYISNTSEDIDEMLAAIGVNSVDQLFSGIPKAIRDRASFDIPSRMDQITLHKHLRQLADSNTSAESAPCFLGAGVYDHYVPPTVQAIVGRSEFYTSYTPYQPEVSQGTLQSIFEFQSLICSLFDMPVANASMYDGATALAEAVIMARDIKQRPTIIFAGSINPFHLDVVKTYAFHAGVSIETTPLKDGTTDLSALRAAVNSETAAIVLQQPNFLGSIENTSEISLIAKSVDALLIASVDPISLSLLKPPGSYGADIVVAEGQSLGCPMGLGGPLLGLFACRSEYMRRLPGRIVGQTTDIDGKRAFVMTLRTREQDIRRERATSNICTNEALYALAAAVYLATMGKNGMKQIGTLCVNKANYAANVISKLDGFDLAYPNAQFFKEFVIRCQSSPKQINEYLRTNGITGGLALEGIVPGLEDCILICVTESRTKEEIDHFAACLFEAGRNANMKAMAQ